MRIERLEIEDFRVFRVEAGDSLGALWKQGLLGGVRGVAAFVSAEGSNA